MPTARALAAQLGFPPTTVARTYRALAGLGFVTVSNPRRGTRIADAGNATRTGAHKAAIAYVQSIRALGVPRSEAIGLVIAALRNV